MICMRSIICAAVICVVFLQTAYTAPVANHYDEAMKHVRALSDSPHVRLLSFGSSYNNRAIPAFVISDFSVDHSHKTRVFICAGQHGNEYNAVRSILELCKSIASEKHTDVLARHAIIVVPVVNPDGVAENERLNAQGLDINRDWETLSSKEAQYVHKIIKAWKPNVLIDAHEWTEHTQLPGNSIELAQSNSKAQNKAMIEMVSRISRRSALTLIPCSAHSNSSLFHRRYTSLGYAAYLLETAFKEDYATKNRAYMSAIFTVLDSLPEDVNARTMLSPASQQFQISAVRAYLEPPASEASPTAAVFYTTGSLLTGYLMLIWIMKPFSCKDKTKWSRRYRICTINSEIEINPLVAKRKLQPITKKSWTNRRLRSRYAITQTNAPAANE